MLSARLPGTHGELRPLHLCATANRSRPQLQSIEQDASNHMLLYPRKRAEKKGAKINHHNNFHYSPSLPLSSTVQYD